LGFAPWPCPRPWAESSVTLRVGPLPRTACVGGGPHRREESHSHLERDLIDGALECADRDFGELLPARGPMLRDTEVF